MHLLNLPTEPVPPHDIVVELVPPRRGRELGTGELGERGDVEAVDDEGDGVEGCGDYSGGGGGGEDGCVHFRIVGLIGFDR